MTYVHESKNNANLGERAKGKDRYQNPFVDVIAAELELNKHFEVLRSCSILKI